MPSDSPWRWLPTNGQLVYAPFGSPSTSSRRTARRPGCTWTPPCGCRPGQMAGLLHHANVGSADGFSLNVASHVADRSALEYGNTLSAMVGDKHYIVDSSRNGKGSDSLEKEWCNSSGLGVGRRPGTLVA